MLNWASEDGAAFELSSAPVSDPSKLIGFLNWTFFVSLLLVNVWGQETFVGKSHIVACEEHT